MADVVYTDVGPTGSRVRWGAIIAGVLIGLVTQVLLSLLGLAIGLTAFDPAQQTDLTGLGVGSGIWLILSTLVSVFVGSWVASWWADTGYRADGVLHGVLTWSLFTLLVLFLLGTGIGNLLGGAFNMLSAGIEGAATGVAASEQQAAGDTNVQMIQERFTDLISQAGPAGERLANLDTSGQIKQQIAQNIATGNDQEAVRLITENTDMSQVEAQRLVQDTQLQTREVAQQATETMSRIAWITFLALLLPLGAAVLGGLLGQRTAPHRTV